MNIELGQDFLDIKNSILTIQPDIRPDTGYPVNSVSDATLFPWQGRSGGEVPPLQPAHDHQQGCKARRRQLQTVHGQVNSNDGNLI